MSENLEMPIAQHELHKIIGDILLHEFGDSVRLDFACSRTNDDRQQLPLFSSVLKSRKTQLCKVDILILEKNEVKVIVEIEESGIIPTKICGKMLTSGLAKYYIPHKQRAVPIANPLLFIQILNSKNIPDNSSIKKQWVNIEAALKRIGEIGGRQLCYKLLFGESENFSKTHSKGLIETIRKFLVI